MFLDHELVKDVLEKIVDIFEKSRVDYGDVRFTQAKTTSIGKDKEKEETNYYTNYGFHLRVLKRGEWRTLGIASLNENEISEEAKGLSSFSPQVKYHAKEPSKIKEHKAWFVDKNLVKEPRLSLEEKTEWVRDAFKRVKYFDKRIVNASCRLSESKSEKIFANTEGSFLRQNLPRFRVIIIAHAKSGKTIQQDYFSEAKISDDSLLKKIDLNKVTRKISKTAISLLNAKKPPSGRFPVIMDRDMAGLIAHESFGHGTEADQVLRNRSFLKNYFKKRVAENFVTICDNGNYGIEWGSFIFDDEGIKSRRNVLIDKGVFKSFLHSRETASVLSFEPTGNGRAQDFLHRVNVRMTNTYFEPVDWDVEELFEGIKYGIYLVKSSHGMEDPEGGGIQVTSNMGWLIENGHKTKLLRSCTLTGKVLELLKNIDAVCKNFKLIPGTCGKGSEDLVPVTSGGPHIRIKEAIVSGG